VPIQSLQEYAFSSVIVRTAEEIESGMYHFRLDYYDEVDPDSNIVSYHDYSKLI
jgi:hypothetical protein